MKKRTADLCSDESLPAAQKRREVEELVRRARAGNVNAIRRVIEITEGPPPEAVQE